jgi:hypothetical protein
MSVSIYNGISWLKVRHDGIGLPERRQDLPAVAQMERRVADLLNPHR